MTISAEDPDFLAPRRCLREPIPAIVHAAELLSAAADAHLAGHPAAAEACIVAAEIPEVRAWLESLWGSAKASPDQPLYLRRRTVEGAQPEIDKALRSPDRMPTRAMEREAVARYGYNCAFCGIPLVPAGVRRVFHAAYPETARWGRTNWECHSAFQCLWLQYDHVVPHARGGRNDSDNIVVTCAGCNYGRVAGTLEEHGLVDPRTREIRRTDWDGLTRILRG